jgi:outer membrane receptor protein involved in Fe transport
MRYFIQISCWVLFYGVVLVFSGLVAAQEQDQDQDQEAPSTNQLEEVIVMGEKREQSLSNVGLSVAVLDENYLKTRNVKTLQDLTQAVPSMTFAETPSGAPTITLRGIGFNEISLSAFPTVALYVDEVPMTFPVTASHINFDMERVEVLQGPQGTIFGQNATGGAINFIAAKPTDEFETGVTLGAGRFSSFEAEGFLSGPISDSVTARFAARLERADGWQESMSRPGDKNGEVRTGMARMILAFNPNENVSFQFNVNGWKDTGESTAPQLIATNVQVPGFLNPAVANAPFAPAKPEAADWTPGLPNKDNTFYQVSLRADIQIMDQFTLTSITSYSDYDQKERDDYDGIPVPEEDYAANDGKISEFAQELRLANSDENRLRWMIGANFADSSVDQQFDYRWEYASTAGLVGSFGYPAIGNQFGTEQDMKTWAVFANLELDITDTVMLKAGARYTEFKAETKNCGTDFIEPYYVGRLFYDFFGGGAAGPYSPGLCFPFNDLGETINGVPPGFPGSFAGSFDENNAPWRVGVDWSVNPDTLLYANITKGYKSGNYSNVGASVFSQYAPVVQESVLSYEVGFKLTLLDRTLQLNGATFYYEYDDKQLRSRTIDPVWGNLDVVQNIPKSSAWGAELSLTARPIEQLTLSLNATYIDATIDKFTGISASGVVADFSGTDMPFTPKFSTNLNADFVTPVSSNFDFIAGASVAYRSSTYAIIGGKTNPPLAEPADQPLFKIDSYTVVDLYVGVESEKWRAVLWGKNVFDEYYWNNVFPAFDTIIRYANKPVTYGMRVSYLFN